MHSYSVYGSYVVCATHWKELYQKYGSLEYKAVLLTVPVEEEGFYTPQLSPTDVARAAHTFEPGTLVKKLVKLDEHAHGVNQSKN